MAKARVKIRNEAGIHLRPSVLVLKSITDYQGTVTLKTRTRTAPLTSVLDLMALGLVKGDKATVIVTGPDEKEVCAKVAKLLETKFDFDPMPPARRQATTRKEQTP
jgi:phosphocarrier protein HPr